MVQENSAKSCFKDLTAERSVLTLFTVYTVLEYRMEAHAPLYAEIAPGDGEKKLVAPPKKLERSASSGQFIHSFSGFTVNTAIQCNRAAQLGP